MPCFECGKEASIEHHVVPHSLGGRRTVSLCVECHAKVHSPESSLSLSRLSRRAPRGPSKVRETETLEILTMRRSGALLREIAERFNISTAHACFVTKGKTRTAKKVLPTLPDLENLV
jgi:hypothetical protein